jgi:hypothetical protein
MSSKKTPYWFLWIVPLFGLIAIVLFALNEGSFTKESISKASQGEFSRNSSKPTLAINPIHILSGGVSIIPIFHQPILEWGTRTLSGITYIFGEGNPKEIQIKLQDEYNQQYADGFTVRPETEKGLLEFLSNPMLATVVNKCGGFIRPRDGMDIGLEQHLPQALFTTDFSLESMISIDLSTGTKILDSDKFDLFGLMFKQISFPANENADTKWEEHLSCLSSGEIEEYRTLVYQYGHVYQSWSNSSYMLSQQ